MAELILAEMVLLCWGKSELLILIKALKFIELVGGNMLAVTNVAICINLALIVSVSADPGSKQVDAINRTGFLSGLFTECVATFI